MRNFYRSIWSTDINLEQDADTVAFQGTFAVRYLAGTWGTNAYSQGPFENPTWGQLREIGETLIRESGDDHHVFIEGFKYTKVPGVLEMYTGS